MLAAGGPFGGMSSRRHYHSVRDRGAPSGSAIVPRRTACVGALPLRALASASPGALAALRRRYVGQASQAHYVRYLREEGRLAALAGDRDGAIRAYRHYLALRSEAEPALQPEVRRVREELEAIERESTDR